MFWTATSAKVKNRTKESEIWFLKILKSKQYHMKVLLNSFHLNGRGLELIAVSNFNRKVLMFANLCRTSSSLSSVQKSDILLHVAS